MNIVQAIADALNRLEEDKISQLYAILKNEIRKRYSTDLLDALVNELNVSGARKDRELKALVQTLLVALNPSNEGRDMGKSGTAGITDAMMARYFPDDEDEDFVIG